MSFILVFRPGQNPAWVEESEDEETMDGRYNVTNGGNEILNLDGPFETRTAADEFADEVERDNPGVECFVVKVEADMD